MLNFLFRCRLLWMVFAIAWPQPHAHSEEPTERPDLETRLEKFLERYPKADLDQNGTLTLEEAKTFRTSQRASKESKRGKQKLARTGLAPDHADLSYGPDPANLFDLWLAESDQPTPLVIFIHGGGFRGGDKRMAARYATMYRAAGISLASINYRMLPEYRFPVPLQDSARAVQTLRHRAAEWNIDPNRIGLTGGSAGAGTSLWIAFHDDMADPESTDPVLRESTRVTCAVVSGAQTSYDPRFFKEHGLDGIMKHPSLPALYAMEEVPTEWPPELLPLFEEVSPIHHLTVDDPPVMLIYSQANTHPGEPILDGEAVHHPRFGIILKEKADSLGMECVLQYPGKEDDAPRFDATAETLSFFKRHFGMGPRQPNANDN